jgi:hypothetical protein
MRNSRNKENENDAEHDELSDFGLERSEVIKKSMNVVPKYIDVKRIEV